MNAESGPRARSRLRGHPAWGPRVLFGLLAAVAAVEGSRLVLTGQSSEARTGGWYLIVVVPALLCGVLGRTKPATAAGPETQEGAEAVSPDSPPAADSSPAAEDSRAATEEGPPWRVRRRGVLVMFAAAVAYAWALPWFGFAVANFAFLAAYLRGVAGRSWWRSLLYAAICDAVFVVGFDLLSVQVPDGVFGIGL